MKVIIDTNILISALIKNSVSRQLIKEFSANFYYPEISLNELKKHKELGLKKSGISEFEYRGVLFDLFKYMIIITKERLFTKIQEADYIIGNIYKNDVVFIAAALSLPNSIIWSNDKHFKKQKKVKVFTTNEMLKLFKLK